MIVTEEAGGNMVFSRTWRQRGHVSIGALPGWHRCEWRMMRHHESVIGFLVRLQILFKPSRLFRQKAFRHAHSKISIANITPDRQRSQSRADPTAIWMEDISQYVRLAECLLGGRVAMA